MATLLRSLRSSIHLAFAVCLAASPLPGQVVNGSFESGAAGWTSAGALSILGPTLGVDGGHCASLGGGDTPNSSLWQTFGADPNVDYVLTFADAAGGDGYPGRIGILRVEVSDGIGNVLASQSFTNVSPSPLAGTNGFVIRTMPFRTPINVNSLTLRFFDMSPNGGVAVDPLIDNVKVTQQSPATVLFGPVTNSANGHIYYLLTQDTWTASEAEAMSLGGHLVTIDDAAEQDWVFSTFGSLGGFDKALWIGFTDREVEGVFRWVSGSPVTYTHWVPGEPNNSGGAENFGVMYPPTLGVAGQWNDLGDSSTLLSGNWVIPVHGVVEVAPPTILTGPITNGANGHLYYLLTSATWWET